MKSNIQMYFAYYGKKLSREKKLTAKKCVNPQNYKILFTEKVSNLYGFLELN